MDGGEGATRAATEKNRKRREMRKHWMSVDRGGALQNEDRKELGQLLRGSGGSEANVYA